MPIYLIDCFYSLRLELQPYRLDVMKEYGEFHLLIQSIYFPLIWV